MIIKYLHISQVKKVRSLLVEPFFIVLLYHQIYLSMNLAGATQHTGTSGNLSISKDKQPEPYLYQDVPDWHEEEVMASLRELEANDYECESFEEVDAYLREKYGFQKITHI